MSAPRAAGPDDETPDPSGVLGRKVSATIPPDSPSKWLARSPQRSSTLAASPVRFDKEKAAPS